MRNITTRFLLIMLAWLLAACASSAPQPIQTIAPADFATQTETPIPTQTVSPTPELGIDMEKFHNFPESYEDLLANLDEFVQAPDPINDRAVFDKWFNDELIPALGPVSERKINIYNNSDAGGNSLWSTRIEKGSKMLELPPVFWFIHDEVVYVVPCISTLNSKLDSTYTRTICPILLDIPFFEKKPSDMIEALQEGQEIKYIRIYYDPDAYRPDLDWGDSVYLIESIGDYPWVGESRVKLGFGSLEFQGQNP